MLPLFSDSCPSEDTTDCETIDQCDCPWNDGPDKENLVSIYFWLDGVTKLLIASVGIFGNIFTIMILSSRELRSTFHSFLVVLAGFDLFYLFLILLEEIPQVEDIITQKTTYPDENCQLNKAWAFLYPYFIHPFQYIFLTSSENLTLAISVDRFIAIKYPLRYYYLWNSTSSDKDVLNKRRKQKKANQTKCDVSKNIDWSRIGSYTFPVFMFSAIYCLPVFFELKTVPNGENGTRIEEDPMYNEMMYIMGYYVLLDCVFRCIIPVFILLFTNYQIYKIVRKQPISPNSAVYQKRAQNMMLFGVVALLMVVHLYRFGLNLYQAHLFGTGYLLCCGDSEKNLIIHMVAYNLLVINSSANWIIYLAASKKFRMLALERYKYMTSKCISTLHRMGRICKGGEMKTDADEPKIHERKRKLTTIAPFGTGYVSWGTSGADNIHVVVSQQNTEKNEVMKVSVDIT